MLILLHHSVSKIFISINFIVEFILVCVKHGLAYLVVSSSTFLGKLMALSFSYCSSVQNGCFFLFSSFLRENLLWDFQDNSEIFSFSITAHVNVSKQKGFVKAKELISRTGIPSIVTSPYESLKKGNWVKLICGASFEDAVDIRNLSLVYTLAGGKNRNPSKPLFLFIVYFCVLFFILKKLTFSFFFFLFSSV